MAFVAYYYSKEKEPPMKKLFIVCYSLIVVSCAHGADNTTQNYTQVYNAFKEAIAQRITMVVEMPEMIRSPQYRMWNRVFNDENTAWQMVKLEKTDTYLLAQHAQHLAVVHDPRWLPGNTNAWRWGGQGWIFATIAQDDASALPSYAECKTLCALPAHAIVGMHTVAGGPFVSQDLIERRKNKDDDSNQPPADTEYVENLFKGKVGGFYWEVHNTLPPKELEQEQLIARIKHYLPRDVECLIACHALSNACDFLKKSNQDEINALIAKRVFLDTALCNDHTQYKAWRKWGTECLHMVIFNKPTEHAREQEGAYLEKDYPFFALFFHTRQESRFMRTGCQDIIYFYHSHMQSIIPMTVVLEKVFSTYKSTHFPVKSPCYTGGPGVHEYKLLDV